MSGEMLRMADYKVPGGVVVSYWRDAKAEAPGVAGEYLAAFRLPGADPGRCVAYFDPEGGWHGFGGPHIMKHVTHWMPLPDPPRLTPPC